MWVVAVSLQQCGSYVHSQHEIIKLVRTQNYAENYHFFHPDTLSECQFFGNHYERNNWMIPVKEAIFKSA